MTTCASSKASKRWSNCFHSIAVQAARRESTVAKTVAGGRGNAYLGGSIQRDLKTRAKFVEKRMTHVRYAYGVTSAVLLAGASLSLMTGFPAGAQVAQNDQAQMQAMTPHIGAPSSFADLTQQLQPAVVNIATRQRVKVQQQNNPFAGTPFGELFGGQNGGQNGERGGQGGAPGQGGQSPSTREAQSLGSGFITSPDGFIVTNNHVISAEGQGQVESITVTTPDGTEYPAQLIGRDESSDLAVLKISATKPLPFVHFGDSTKSRVGDWVIAIGNPFGQIGRAHV